MTEVVGAEVNHVRFMEVSNTNTRRLCVRPSRFTRPGDRQLLVAHINNHQTLHSGDGRQRR